jgi:hypothetical protein
MKEGSDFVQAGARHLAYSLARTFAASLLLEFASRGGDARSAECARRWCRRGLVSLSADAGADHRASSLELFRGLGGA